MLRDSRIQSPDAGREHRVGGLPQWSPESCRWGRICIDDGLISLVVKKCGADEPPGPGSAQWAPLPFGPACPSLPPHLPESPSRLLGYPGLGLNWRVRSFFHRRPPCAIRCRAQAEHAEETNKTSFRFLEVQAWCSHCCDLCPGLYP